MSLEEEMRAARANFSVEAADLLVAIESGLLELEHGDPEQADPETVNSIFRAAHTVKGSAGLFGLDDIVAFTHVMESVLDRLRDGKIEVSRELVGALLPCTDHLGLLINDLSSDAEPTADHDHGRTLLVALQPFIEDTPAPVAGASTDATTDGSGADPASDGAGDGRLHLSLRFGPDLLRGGMDPLAFVSYLASTCEILAVTPMTELLPAADDFDAESCYLALEVTLRTEDTPEAILDVFEFVREESDIRVLPVGAGAAPFVDLVQSYGEHADAVRAVLVRHGVLDASALDAAPGGGTPPPDVAPASTAAAPDGAAAPAPTAERRSGTERRGGPVPAQRGSTETAAAQYIRVDADRLDRLIDAVGELVIAGAGASLRAALTGDEPLETAVAEVMRLVEEVRDNTLQLRMVPIGTTFSRFQRVVRDVSAALDKDVSLVISGGDTEVDKALVEQIGDPLMHLVRNALDHGIESREARAAAGKPDRGTLRLNAFHDSGSIVIEVSDDGGGIDPAVIRAKAVERGLIAPDATPSDAEILMMIFEPGFSTKQQVSDLSGRGVGMDVVKRNVTSMRGTIDVDSRSGLGSTFRIRLPLTLAIIDGFMVGVGNASFVIPLDRVLECVELPQGGRGSVMDLRDEVLPYVRLRDMFAIGGEAPRRENVVVVEYAGTKTGLVVDALRGEFQTVIKPLGPLFEHVEGIGGSTILGNGDVALIIDVPMLVQHAGQDLGARAGRTPAVSPAG